MNRLSGTRNPHMSRFSRKEHCWKIFLCLAAVLFLLSATLRITSENAEKTAERLGRKTEKRLEILDRYADKALASDHSTWIGLEDIPQDMVIYRYVYDTLQSWCNQFPISNDDISTRVIFERLSNLRSGIASPLSEVGDGPVYMNLGPRWYLMKTKTDGLGCRIVYGLEIKNTLLVDRQSSESGVNAHLGLPKNYDVMAVNHSGGVPVFVDGKPLFKVISETTRDIPFPANALLRWCALICFLISVILYFQASPSIRRFPFAVTVIAIICTIAYRWGIQLKNVSEIFSPGIYADGSVLFSFGALMILNCFVFCYLLCVYTCRKDFIRKTLRSRKRYSRLIYSAGIILTMAASAIYVHATFVSLILNSGITLELYQWFNLSVYTIAVYVSYIAILFGLLLMLQMLRPVVHSISGFRYNAMSKRWFFGFSVFCALYFTVTTAVLGFRKEENRIMVMTNRLAVDRDLSLEIQLRTMEDEIASDPMVATLSELDRSEMIILNRLNENYLYRVSQDYTISVAICRDNAGGRSRRRARCLDYFGKRFMDGTPVADNSRFRFISDEFGNSSYLGSFIYYSPSSGVVHMFLEIEEKNRLGETGYMILFGRPSGPDHVNLPRFYSYGKFISGKLTKYRGNYPYPAVLDQDLKDRIDSGISHFRENGYIHFVNRISESEVIITSRSVRGWITYIVNFSYLIILIYGILYVAVYWKRSRKEEVFSNYYRSRINSVLSLSIFLTLIVITSASVAFVYKRNSVNMYNLMSDKINTLQGLMESRTKHADDWHDLNAPDFAAAVEDISNTTRSDITLYTPSGKVFRSTTPEVFEKMMLGSRMNQKAYYNIRFKAQRFYICNEKIAGSRFYSLYAPLYNEKGTIVAILNSPYTDQNYMFRHDAFFYSAIIFNLFIILLIFTVILSTAAVNAIFKPLTEIGKKMSSTDIHSLEHIRYDHDDEISTLVKAYNMMVTDLSESTRKLAQAERDKAWSEMARQIAHEIKNPLTPIKLEIQRLIRLKNRHDPNWDEKFDKVSEVVLEHIDILTETANEFSTFAKLYSEEPVLIDLDAVLRDQLMIFDNKDNISFSYLGMPEAYVMAPKPQLIRVFVNLMTNAVQAIEIQQKEYAEEGRPVKAGEILICLRNSTKDGYYDVVFEDNGPGVSEENQDKLFTPNFTTKSSGTGLGLAISRNIVEKCNGEILYRKSYNLYGACFTVRLPKQQERHGDQ